MLRHFVVASVLLLFACTDQTDVSTPAQDADAASGGDTLSPLELSLDASSSLSAHTALSGGATTVFDATPNAFSLAAPNLAGLSLARHETGDAEFEIAFVPAPASANGGLGPVFDNVSCEECHQGDGRGRPPLPGEQISSLLFRASVAGVGPHGGPNPVPGFGGQLQLRAIPGFDPEIKAMIGYVEQRGRFADGTAFSLRVPRYTLGGVYRPLPAGVLFSPRVAPVVFGLGLLEAVPEGDILSRADPADRNRDGISGRVNYVWNAVRQRTVVGRFGWKANTPTLLQQTAGAYNGDMGVTSSLFPAESCEGQVPGCGRHAPEVDDQTVGNVAFYSQTLGVPARRNLDDPNASAGERLFYAAGCAGCHTPTLRTGVLRGIPEVSNQVIHPYTDLLVHDMGDGLADDRPDFQASGREWRTPPLWGIGLVQTVNDHTDFLHDGRARSLLEAVLWHGGEAAGARERVRRFSVRERAALIAFLQSL
jgi:CxxC motif-containing protein (DUF1111 family)